MMPDEVGYAFWPGIMRLDIAGCGWMTVAVGGQLGSHLGFARNQLWCEIIALACELLAWTQLLTLAGEARRWEPKRLQLRLFSAARCLVRGGRRLRLRLAARWPWAGEITAAVTRLQALPSG